MKIFISTGSRNIGSLYHKTGLNSLYAILKTGKLALAYADLDAEEIQHGRNRSFFSSFTRSKASPFLSDTFNSTTYAIIEFDGSKLSSSVKIVPVNYFSNLKHDEHIKERENEERLISNKPSVDVLKYIKSVSIIRTLARSERNKGLLNTVSLLKRLGIEFAFYDSYNSWIRRSPCPTPSELPPFPKRQLSASDKNEYKNLMRLRNLLVTDPAKWEGDILKFAESLKAAKRAHSIWSALVPHQASYMNSYVGHSQLNQKLFRRLKSLGITDSAGLCAYIRNQFRILKVNHENIYQPIL